MKNFQKRRRYFIKQNFQGRFIFSYFLLLVLGSLFFLLILSFFSAQTLSFVYENYHLKLGTMPGILFDKILSSQWLLMVAGSLLVVWFALHASHRIAGPFFRIEKALDGMIAQDLSAPVTLRKRDEGKAIAAKLNEFNERLSRQLEEIDNANAQIGIHVRMLETALEKDPPDAAELSRCMAAVKTGQAHIEGQVNQFTFARDHVI